MLQAVEQGPYMPLCPTKILRVISAKMQDFQRIFLEEKPLNDSLACADMICENIYWRVWCEKWSNTKRSVIRFQNGFMVAMKIVKRLVKQATSLNCATEGAAAIINQI